MENRTINISLILDQDFLYSFIDKYGVENKDSLELELQYVFTNEIQNLVDAIRNKDY